MNLRHPVAPATLLARVRRRTLLSFAVALTVGAVSSVVTVVSGVALASPAAAAGTVAETTGGAANTWTNYTNAGGTQGPTIPAFATVQIACRLTGFRVADGNTWWYQIASSPWNYSYYVSADAFYNNGQTSGPLAGTPWVDTNVPVCGSGGGVQETTGGAANTWTNYTNAGGTQGATIGSHATVTIACKVTGFRVADGNTWWYQVASSPWNNGFYVSADAFYNNGQTSGSLAGTPFVDPNVPDCTPSGGGGGGTTTRGETTGGAAHTWSDYSNAGGTQGQTIPSYTTVQISCKTTGFKVADGNTWWYLVASSPWSNQYYVSADAFYNNGATSGSLIGTPYVDTNVPDCSSGARPSGETAGGVAHTWTDYTNAGGLQGASVAAGQTIQVTCRVSGFVVADSNSWWYLISSSPWNNAYFVSADAFYNNGQTSGSLAGTPFVDQSVPICGGIHVAPVPGTAYAVSSASTNHASCISGDPVNCASGDFFETGTDIVVGGRGPGLNLARTYNSLTATSSGIFGAGWSSTYDQHLVVSSDDGSVTITLADGSQVVAEPGSGGAFTLPAYANSALRQNSDGTYTLTVHARTLEKFSAAGKLLSISDLNNYTTTLDYSNGKLTTITDPSGRQISLTTGSNGLVSSAADPMGRTTHYSYDAAGNLTKVVDPIGGSTTLEYDTKHLLTKITDPRGGAIINTFDGQGRILTQRDAAGLINTWAYSGDNFSSVGGTTTITDPHGVVEVQRYANGFLNQIIKAYGTSLAATWSYSYDPNTFGLTSVTDPNGHVTRFAYDNAGNRTSATDATGNTTTTTYNSLDEPLTVTTPLGEVTTRRYDSAGNLLSTTDASGNTTTNTYGDSSHPGDVTAISNAAGHTTSFTYDAYGDVKSHTTNPSSSTSNTSVFVSDADGETTCLVEPDEVAQGITCAASGPPTRGTATQTIDAAGRPTSVTDPAGGTTTYTYDADGNLTKSVNADGHETTRVFDADNRLTSTTRGGDSSHPSTTMNSYDLTPGSSTCPAGTGAVWCNATTDADGHVTTAVFNALGDKITELRPGGKSTSFTYDAAGELLSVVDAAGRTTTYAYDDANRRVSVSYSSSSTHRVTYAYNADGRRTKMTDATGTTTTTYDPNGRITSVTDGSGATVSYGYDAAGEQTSVTYPGNHLVRRTFDGAGEMKSVSDWQGNSTHFSYDADGNLTGTALPNGDSTDRTYDPNDQLISTTTSSATGKLAGFTYSRDATGLITREVDSGALTGTTSYTYDAQGRLASTNATDYGYDPNGNLVSSGAVSQTYDGADELTASDNGTGVKTSYSYNALGDRTATTPTTGYSYSYVYDQNGRLASATATPGDPPAVTAVSASSGSTYGGETVTITGTHLTGATAVTFGSVPAGSFTVVSDSKITATAPAEGPGKKDVTVTTPSGTSAATSDDQYSFAPPVPTVTSLSPKTGGSAGHATTVITGTGFSYATGVTFGADAALDFTVDSDTQITATTPGGALGVVDARVSTSAGTSPVVTGDRYTYVKPPRPAVTSISPATGTTGGGTSVNVKGTGFWGASKVAFASTAGTSIQVLSDTELTVTSPAHAVGQTHLTVTTPGGTSATSTADIFRFVAPPKPTVTQVSPSSGTRLGGTSVTVTGSWFDNATKLTLNGTAVSDFLLVSPTTIKFTTPAHAVATVNVQVKTSGGTSDRTVDDRFAFVAAPAPAITSLSPATGKTAGGTTVTITGTAFTAATRVTFGGTAAKSFTVDSSTEITAVTPAHASGRVRTAVTTPAGSTTSVAADVFTFDAKAPSKAPHRRSSSLVVAAGQPTPTTTTYQYNGDGLRSSETNDSGTQVFTWDTTSGVPRILYDSANFYIYGPDGAPVEQITPGEIDYFVTDVVGSTRMLLSSDGGVGATFSNSPYGDQATSTGTARTPLTYAGAYADPASGLQYMVNRSYDPASGQFTTVDPLAGSSGSAYGYAGDEPVTSADPLGLIAWRKDLETAGKVGAGAGLMIAAAGLIATGVGAPAGAAAAITGAGIVAGGIGLGLDTGMTIYDCNSTNMEYSRQCGGDAANLIVDSVLLGVSTKGEGHLIGDVAENVDHVKAVEEITRHEVGEDGYQASGGTAALSISTSFICISLQQSSTRAAEYLQPAAHTSYFQPAATASYFQPASSAPVQQSSNVGSLLQGGPAFTGHIFF